MSDPNGMVTLTFSHPRWRPEWAVPEAPVPEPYLNDQCIEHLRAQLRAWAERERRTVLVARNLGIRWHQSEPRAGFDPYLCVIEPPPPGPLDELHLWEPGHEPPWLAVEIVDPDHRYKDYLDTPARAAACGVRELWIYDPLLAGPTSRGGPFALQIWTRHQQTITRTHASNAPGYSPALDAWLLPEVDPNAAKRRHRGARDSLQLSANPATRLRIMTAEIGGAAWPTLVEAERARADAAEEKLQRLERELEALCKKS